MAKQTLSLDDWMKEVDRLFEDQTGCSWADLGGDEELIKTSYLAGEAPQQFVDGYCEKYKLWDIRKG